MKMKLKKEKILAKKLSLIFTGVTKNNSVVTTLIWVQYQFARNNIIRIYKNGKRYCSSTSTVIHGLGTTEQPSRFYP